jgi:predicted ATPase/class 3 adenylate cyclase
MPPDPALPTGQASETLAFLFTDLEGSTRLWERYPEAMKGALRRHDAILQAAVEAPGGRVVKSTGDGTMAVFSSAVDGAAACLAAQRALSAEQWPETGPLKVRMGLHCGLAERRVDDFFGPTVNRTARLMAAGHGGQVLFSAAAAALAAEHLPDHAGFRDLGEHRLKDLGRPEHVYQLVHPDLPVDFPPLVTVTAVTASLPARAAAFIGRHAELDAIANCLENPSMRLVTLLGPGGTGKTALAIRAAENAAAHFADGVVFVDLASIRDTPGVLTAIARAVGVSDSGKRPLFETLTAHLHERRTLLILDNFEQVTVAAGIVADLLAQCPRVTALVTSREALHVRAEHVRPVSPLDLPPAGPRPPTATQVEAHEAAQLFVDRARAIRPDFRLTDENAAAVADICRRLDGLPLAIELAAARLALLTPEALLAHLQNRLKLLRSGPRDLPVRQQTLRAAIDWSYEMLRPGEQRVFELLSVFADAAIADAETVSSAIAVFGDGDDILDHLASLTEKSLVRRIETPGGEPRLAMLETIREYAADRLAQNADFEAAARLAHATRYATFAEDTHARLNGAFREAALAEMAAEIGNLQIAWRYWVAAADLSQLDRLVESLLILNDARGWYADTAGLTTDLLSILAKEGSSPHRAGQEIALRVSLARALMATKGFTPEVEEAYNAALEIFERDAGGGQQYPVLRGLTRLYELRAEDSKAAELGEQILAIGAREKNLKMQVDGLRVVGTADIFRNELERGLSRLETAIAAFSHETMPSPADGGQVGCDPRISCFTTAGLVLMFLGRPERAVGRANDALELASRLRHPFSSAYANFHAALLHYWLRSYKAADGCIAALLDIADEYDFRTWTAAGTCLRGATDVGLGRKEEGLARVTEGMTLYQGLRSPPVFWPMLLSIQAEASLAAGHSAEGLAAIEAAIGITAGSEDNVLIPHFCVISGDLHRSMPAGMADEPVAPRLYRRAFEKARQLKARLSQLRAATRLVGVSPAGAERDAALRDLQAVYGEFTEGQAFPDLVDARTVLAGESGAA